MRGKRAVGVLGVALLVLILTGCAVAGPAGPPDQARTDRQRLVEAFRDRDARLSELIRDVTTSITPQTAPWLPGWRVLDVSIRSMPHPRRFFVALADGGRTELLSGRPDAYAAVLRSAGVAITTAEQAVDVSTVFLDATRDFQRYAYRIAAVDDIAWRPQLTTDQQRDRAEIERIFRSRVGPAAATGDHDGWTVTAWMVRGSDLVRHTIVVGRDGALTDSETLERSGLPVPESR